MKNKYRNVIWTFVGIILMVDLVTAVTFISDTDSSFGGDIFTTESIQFDTVNENISSTATGEIGFFSRGKYVFNADSNDNDASNTAEFTFKDEVNDYLTIRKNGNVEIDMGNLSLNSISSNFNVTDSLNIFSGKGGSGDNPIKFYPINSTNGYIQLAFYPESDFSMTEGDILINIHKNHTDGTLHQHMSVYTTRADNVLRKRIDLDYAKDYADMDIQNIDTLNLQQNRLLIEDTGNKTWGEVDIYTDASNNSLIDFNLQVANKQENVFVRLFRQTNTTGTRTFSIFQGDNTVTKAFEVNAVTGDVTIGNGTYQANVTLTSPDGTEYQCGVSNGGTFMCS